MERLSNMEPGTQVAVYRDRLIWPGRTEPLTTVGYQAGRIERLRNWVVLYTVGLYILFNWGFMQLRIPPVAGGGLPIGEIVLVMALATINYTTVFGRMSHLVPLAPFMIWWAFGVSRALYDFGAYGAWALRDAAHVVESLFILVGFAFAGDPKAFDRFFRWLPKLLFAAVLYGLTYPIQDEVWTTISPTIISGSGFQVPILGSMSNTALLIIVAAMYLLLFRGRQPLMVLLAVLLLGYTMAMFQARTLYLVVIAIFGFLFLYRRSSIGYLAIVVYLAVLLLALLPLLDLRIQGRLGAEFSADFMVQHFLAIFGISSSEYDAVTSAAAGIDQRLEWWRNIFEEMLSDPFKLLLGLGYGVPLTDFAGKSGAIVREPHNSYVTVIARTGIVGAVAWLLVMYSLFRRWHHTFRRCQALRWRTGQNRLMILMIFFICIWVLAIGEDGFEKPYNIIPFYFFWGIVLRFALMLQRGEIGPEAEMPSVREYEVLAAPPSADESAEQMRSARP